MWRKKKSFEPNTFWLWAKYIFTLSKIHVDFEQNTCWLWAKYILTLSKIHVDFEPNTFWLINPIMWVFLECCGISCINLLLLNFTRQSVLNFYFPILNFLLKHFAHSFISLAILVKFPKIYAYSRKSIWTPIYTFLFQMVDTPVVCYEFKF